MFHHRNFNEFLSFKSFGLKYAVSEINRLIFESVDIRTFWSCFNTGYFCDLYYNLTPQMFVLVMWMCTDLWHRAKRKDMVLTSSWSCINHLQDKNISQRSLFVERHYWKIPKRSRDHPGLCSSMPGMTAPSTSVHSLCDPEQCYVYKLKDSPREGRRVSTFL